MRLDWVRMPRMCSSSDVQSALAGPVILQGPKMSTLAVLPLRLLQLWAVPGSERMRRPIIWMETRKHMEGVDTRHAKSLWRRVECHPQYLEYMTERPR